MCAGEEGEDGFLRKREEGVGGWGNGVGGQCRSTVE